MKKHKVVVIGGGTGTFTVLSGLKKYPDLDLSVIVSMMDDGGSNKVIRDEFGLLPTSDIRQCLVALSSNDSDKILRKLFTYRYASGQGISGMTFGNLFMAALTDIYKGDQKKAIKETCEILKIKGKIIPVTFEKTTLLATYFDGTKLLGEHVIDEPPAEFEKNRIVNLEVTPKVQVNKEALEEIENADLIVLGPGDFYTSILPNIIIDGVSESIRRSKAKVLYVLNLMTKYGQTLDYKASDFIKELNKYLGEKRIDYCVVNTNTNLSRDVLEKYKKEKAEIVIDDLVEDANGMRVIRGDLISSKSYVKNKSDILKRSFVRHDSSKLAEAIVGIFTK